MSLRIIYMGTPEFAVAPLKKLVEAKKNIVAVITAPDRPAGRGLQLQESEVKKYALANNLKILQPTNLKNEDFIEELKALRADLQIVVAFRMLPEIVWNMPPLGTFNLHASLLPQYRGAAPINWAIINGEKESGVTTFFLKHEIDTGDIIQQEKTTIGENETAGELHDKLMNSGAILVLNTVTAIENKEVKSIKQNTDANIKHAPKIFKDTCKINWNLSAEKIHNLVRGLSPYPAAYTELSINDKITSIKIFKTEKNSSPNTLKPGQIATDGKTFINIGTSDGIIQITELQMAGKKRMATHEFLRGFQLSPNSYFIS
ncbi:MAG: methionyl-tRNA formyltransferase [Bacteroidetes bacterium]|nr:methionyl-tRNA formyltransferase [Bacteroidota bacterium]